MPTDSEISTTPFRELNPSRKHKLRHDYRVLLLALGGGLPAVALTIFLLWWGNYEAKTQWTFSLLVILIWLATAFSLRERVVRPLQTVANLIAALHEEDFSIRARGINRNDALGELLFEVNSLNDTLRKQKRSAMAAASLLQAAMTEIEVAVFAFDDELRLRFVNRAGEKLLAKPVEWLTGRKPEEIGLADCLEVASPTIKEIQFPGASGRWGVRRSTFRDNGLPHQLLMLTDLSQALRAEERKAWQQIVRVMGHELNNSLTPIHSIAGSLTTLFARNPRPPDWEEDAQRGMAIIAARAESLRRFMNAYAQLAKLPPPRLATVAIKPLLERVVALERRLPVQLQPGQEFTLHADSDQIEQLLINLIRNAVEAALETGGGVQVAWSKQPRTIEITITDEGHGIAGTKNLFVPFFTTKQGGSGIGLVLSRQIAEAHGGTLTLENRNDRSGCVAKLILPM